MAFEIFDQIAMVVPDIPIAVDHGRSVFPCLAKLCMLCISHALEYSVIFVTRLIVTKPFPSDMLRMAARDSLQILDGQGSQ